MELELGASWSTEDLGTLPQLITTSGLGPGPALQAHLHSSKIRHRLYFSTTYMQVHNCVRNTHVAAAADSTVHEAVLTLKEYRKADKETGLPHFFVQFSRPSYLFYLIQIGALLILCSIASLSNNIS